MTNTKQRQKTIGKGGNYRGKNYTYKMYLVSFLYMQKTSHALCFLFQFFPHFSTLMLQQRLKIL